MPNIPTIAYIRTQRHDQSYTPAQQSALRPKWPLAYTPPPRRPNPLATAAALVLMLFGVAVFIAVAVDAYWGGR